MPALMKPEHLEAPFSIGCFEFTSTGIELHGEPTRAEAESVFEFVSRAVKYSGFWMVDLIGYIDSREDWREWRDQILSVETGLTAGTVSVYRSIGKSVPPANRVEGLSLSHHRAVAKLDDGEQKEWLHKSKDEGWSSNELKAEVRASSRLNLVKGSARGVQQLEIVLHVSVEAPSYTKAATLASAEVKRLIKTLPGGLILDANIAIVKARK